MPRRMSLPSYPLPLKYHAVTGASARVVYSVDYGFHLVHLATDVGTWGRPGGPNPARPDHCAFPRGDVAERRSEPLAHVGHEPVRCDHASEGRVFLAVMSGDTDFDAISGLTAECQFAACHDATPSASAKIPEA